MLGGMGQEFPYGYSALAQEEGVHELEPLLEFLKPLGPGTQATAFHLKSRRPLSKTKSTSLPLRRQ